jgi:hypothetical protein
MRRHALARAAQMKGGEEPRVSVVEAEAAFAEKLQGSDLIRGRLPGECRRTR